MGRQAALTSTPLRLVFVANSVRRGGAETQLVRVALGCAERGHEVRVITFLDRDGWQWELHAKGVELVHLPTPSVSRAPVTLARAVRWCRELRPDALIGFDYQPSLAVRLIGRLADVPVVVSSIRNEDLGRGRLREASIRLSDQLATVTTTNSVRVGADLLERRLVSASRLEILANGMDIAALDRPAETRERVRSSLAVSEGTFLWLSVSYLRAEKDVGTLLDAVEILRTRTDHPFEVAIAGDGALLDSLAATAVARDLSSHVRFLGRRTDVPDLLAAADAFVLTSRAEGLPNAVMEAMAARLPVVATAAGGVPELVEDGRNGRTVPIRDAEAVAVAMRAVMELDPSERHAMGEDGRALIEDRYSLPTLIDGWESLLVTQVERAGRSRPSDDRRREARSEPAGTTRTGR